QGTALTPAQYYRHKSAVYSDLLSVVPPGPLQEQVVQATLSFAETSNFRAENHIEWFLPINILVGRMAIDPLGTGRFSSLLRESKDPVVALFAALEAAAPRTPDKIMALF